LSQILIDLKFVDLIVFDEDDSSSKKRRLDVLEECIEKEGIVLKEKT